MNNDNDHLRETVRVQDNQIAWLVAIVIVQFVLGVVLVAAFGVDTF